MTALGGWIAVSSGDYKLSKYSRKRRAHDQVSWGKDEFSSILHTVIQYQKQ